MSDETLQQAIDAIKGGDKQRGRELLAEVLEADRTNEQAWLWLTQTNISHEEKMKSLNQVLRINPNNQAAKDGLAKLQGKGLLGKAAPTSKPSNPDTMACPYCAETIKAEATVCRFCNRDLITGEPPTQQPQVIIQKTPKNRGMAILLALFLGGLGVHKFYLNRPGAGILYLLLCWTFIPLVVSILESIGYLLMSDEAFQNRFG